MAKQVKKVTEPKVKLENKGACQDAIKESSKPKLSKARKRVNRQRRAKRILAMKKR
jgi:hypothetical protein